MGDSWLQREIAIAGYDLIGIFFSPNAMDGKEKIQGKCN